MCKLDGVDFQQIFIFVWTIPLTCKHIETSFLIFTKNTSFVCLCSLAKKLPKNEPQPAGTNTVRNRGVDLTETAQPAKGSCCSN